MFRALFANLQRSWAALVHEDSSMPALDGLRTYAIGSVVASHCASEFLASGGTANWITRFPLVQGGWIGVDLFFVLSGFLIGSQLTREFAKKGTVDIGAFVVRRGLRIWPLYYLVLFSCVFFRLHPPAPANAMLWPEVFFVGNYFNGNWLPGSWSLCVEEQFYLFAPLALFIVGKLLGKQRRYLLFFSAVALAIAPAIRAFIWFPIVRAGLGEISHEIENLYFPFHTHYDGLAAGFLLASLDIRAFDPAANASRFAGIPSVAFAAATGALLWWVNRPVFNFSALALVFASVVFFVVRFPRGIFSRILGFSLFKITSRLSFGIYLVHRLVSPHLASWFHDSFPALNPELGWLLLYAAIWLVSGAIALTTYLCLEQPFIRLRNRLLAHKSNGLEKPTSMPIHAA